MNKTMLINLGFILFLLALCSCNDDHSTTPVAGNTSEIKAMINFEAVAQSMKTIPPQAENSMNDLTSYICACTSNEPEKAYAVYKWIRYNIKPDYEQLSEGSVDPKTQYPEYVFLNRKAVCDGYARLFQRLILMLELDARRVYGYAVMTTYNTLLPPSGYFHVWNAVEIDDKWYLVEPSWNTSLKWDGSTDPDYFFFTEPTDFIYRHFPENSQWQLLEEQITEEKFWSELLN